MKKFVLALILAVFTATSAWGATMGVYSKGFLVPATNHNYGTADTVVGFICSDNMEVFWTFYDDKSAPIVDGKILCTKNDLVLWSLNQEVVNVGEREGYIIFTGDAIEKPKNDWYLDKDGPTIAGNAFIVDVAMDDAVYLPVIPLKYSDYKPGVNLRMLGPDSIVGLANGFGRDRCSLSAAAKTTETTTCRNSFCIGNDGGGGTETINSCRCFADFRYWTDEKYGAETKIIIWSTDCLEKTLKDDPRCYVGEDKKTYCHVAVYDEDENIISLSIPMGCEYTEIDPSCLVGWPGWTEGFIRIPRALMGDGAFGFSYVHSKTFSAQQTLLAVEGCFIDYEHE